MNKFDISKLLEKIKLLVLKVHIKLIMTDFIFFYVHTIQLINENHYHCK